MSDAEPTNKELLEHVQQVANKLDETGEFLESVAYALANQYKFIADRMPDLSDSERDFLRELSQRALIGVKKHTEKRKLLRAAVGLSSRN